MIYNNGLYYKNVNFRYNYDPQLLLDLIFPLIRSGAFMDVNGKFLIHAHDSIDTFDTSVPYIDREEYQFRLFSRSDAAIFTPSILQFGKYPIVHPHPQCASLVQNENECVARLWVLSPTIPFSLLDSSYGYTDNDIFQMRDSDLRGADYLRNISGTQKTNQFFPIKTISASWISDLDRTTGSIPYAYPFVSKEPSPLMDHTLKFLFNSDDKLNKSFRRLIRPKKNNGKDDSAETESFKNFTSQWLSKKKSEFFIMGGPTSPDRMRLVCELHALYAGIDISAHSRSQHATCSHNLSNDKHHEIPVCSGQGYDSKGTRRKEREECRLLSSSWEICQARYKTLEADDSLINLTRRYLDIENTFLFYKDSISDCRTDALTYEKEFGCEALDICKPPKGKHISKHRSYWDNILINSRYMIDLPGLGPFAIRVQDFLLTGGVVISHHRSSLWEQSMDGAARFGSKNIFLSFDGTTQSLLHLIQWLENNPWEASRRAYLGMRYASECWGGGRAYEKMELWLYIDIMTRFVYPVFNKNKILVSEMIKSKEKENVNINNFSDEPPLISYDEIFEKSRLELGSNGWIELVSQSKDGWDSKINFKAVKAIPFNENLRSEKISDQEWIKWQDIRAKMELTEIELREKERKQSPNELDKYYNRVRSETRTFSQWWDKGLRRDELRTFVKWFVTLRINSVYSLFEPLASQLVTSRWRSYASTIDDRWARNVGGEARRRNKKGSYSRNQDHHGRMKSEYRQKRNVRNRPSNDQKGLKQQFSETEKKRNPFRDLRGDLIVNSI